MRHPGRITEREVARTEQNQPDPVSIGHVAAWLGEHPETLRIWERNDLIRPDRKGYQRKYTAMDLLRLRFIQQLMQEKGLNIAGVRLVIGLYTCWYKHPCAGGASRDGRRPINPNKPCWMCPGMFCVKPEDKSEMCADCRVLHVCQGCEGCRQPEAVPPAGPSPEHRLRHLVKST